VLPRPKLTCCLSGRIYSQLVAIYEKSAGKLLARSYRTELGTEPLERLTKVTDSPFACAYQIQNSEQNDILVAVSAAYSLATHLVNRGKNFLSGQIVEHVPRKSGDHHHFVDIKVRLDR